MQPLRWVVVAVAHITILQPLVAAQVVAVGKPRNPARLEHLGKEMLEALLLVQVTVVVAAVAQEPLVVRHMELMELMEALAALELHQAFLEHPLTTLEAAVGLLILLAQAQLVVQVALAAVEQALMLLVLMPLHLAQPTQVAVVAEKVKRLLLPVLAAQA
jgi:hypothetical protein